MAKYIDLKKTRPRVTKLLTKKPELRDDDNRLIANIWWEDITKGLKLNLNSMSALDLLKLVAEGKLTHSESIIRMRRKVQEENAELRGELYEKRNKKTVKIQQELGYNV